LVPNTTLPRRFSHQCVRRCTRLRDTRDGCALPRCCNAPHCAATRGLRAASSTRTTYNLFATLDAFYLPVCRWLHIDPHNAAALHCKIAHYLCGGGRTRRHALRHTLLILSLTPSMGRLARAPFPCYPPPAWRLSVSLPFLPFSPLPWHVPCLLCTDMNMHACYFLAHGHCPLAYHRLPRRRRARHLPLMGAKVPSWRQFCKLLLLSPPGAGAFRAGYLL